MNPTKHMHQDATWWTISPDGFGGDTFGAPALVKCRWEERSEIFRGPTDDRELISQAVVYVDRIVSVGDYLCLGDQTLVADPSVLAGCYKIQRVDSCTDLRNLVSLYKAIL